VTVPAALDSLPRIVPAVPRDVQRVLQGLATLGGIVFLVGIYFAPERTWANLLVATCYFLGLGLAALFFVAVAYLSKAAWTTVFRRVPEAMAMTIPAGALLFAVTALGAKTIYEWTHQDLVAENALLADKSGWLNLPFFLARAAIYLVIWIIAARIIVKTSRAQDVDGSMSHTRRNMKSSAIFMVVFAITFLGASFDWLMSVQPEWYSTIFGWYNFSGSFVAGLAAMTIIVIVLRRAGSFRGLITDHHLHDLGKYCFAFSTFWAYLWFSQFMLIWYANIPEETSFYVRQMSGGWLSLFLLNFGLNWVIPFLTLMPRAAKRSEGVLLKVCTVLLIGHWLDLYLMVLPAKSGATPPFGIWEIGIIVGAGAVFALLVFHFLRQANLIPVKDPTLERSLQHHI
jgi:hypothetical protein